MKRFIMASILAGILGLSVVGCTSDQQGTAGMLTGVVAGGALGSAVSGGSTAGTIVGAAAGGFAGEQIGQNWNDHDQYYQNGYYYQ
ncbi:MAG: glycine zipper 2TM domain-containing protein [Legionellales bacterium]|nr:glycine zipper 2TM domain-containing protein [Legionellales bacterium]